MAMIQRLLPFEERRRYQFQYQLRPDTRHDERIGVRRWSDERSRCGLEPSKGKGKAGVRGLFQQIGMVLAGGPGLFRPASVTIDWMPVAC